MATNLFHPFVGAARAACANLSPFHPSAPFLLIPWSPLRILPLRTRLTPEHNGQPISFLPRFYLLVFKYMPSLNVCTYFVSLFLDFRRFLLRENISIHVYCDSKIVSENRGSEFTEIYVIILAIKFLRIL